MLQNRKDSGPQNHSSWNSWSMYKYYGTDKEWRIIVSLFKSLMQMGQHKGTQVKLEATGYKWKCIESSNHKAVGSSGEYVVNILWNYSDGDNGIFVQNSIRWDNTRNSEVKLEATGVTNAK